MARIVNHCVILNESITTISKFVLKIKTASESEAVFVYFFNTIGKISFFRNPYFFISSSENS